MDEYQEALKELKEFVHSELDGTRMLDEYLKHCDTLQELIDKHKKVKEDLLFLKEQGAVTLKFPSGRKFLALEITNIPSEEEYKKELFETLINNIINNIINGE